MYSPCNMCKIHFNREYSSDCVLDCDYAVAANNLRDLSAAVVKFSESLKEKERKQLIEIADTYQ